MINREILDRACLGVASAQEGASLRRGVLSMMDELDGLERFRGLRIRHNDEMAAKTKQLIVAQGRIAELEAECEGARKSRERIKELESENKSLIASVDLNYEARKKVITANARIAELETENERANKMELDAVAENVLLNMQVAAWFAVYKTGEEVGCSIDEDPDATMALETERLIELHSAAVDHAHEIDSGRRCPTCKGAGGFHTTGFVPCPECDGNPWEEILEEAAAEAARTLESETR